MSLEDLRVLENEIRKIVPEFEIRFKNESLYQKVLGFLIFPFNRDYMTKYTTTVYPHVYFPTKDYYETQPSSMTILAHEMVHLIDTKASPTWWRLSYGLPQVLAILPMIAFGILAGPYAWILAVAFGAYLFGCLLAKKSIALFWVMTLGGIIYTSITAVMLTGWSSAAFFGALFCMAPWPAPWRSSAELRGYTMNLAIMYWTFGGIPDLLNQSILRKFITSAYYFMAWGHDTMYNKLLKAGQDAQSGVLQTKYPYSVAYKFLAERGLLKK